MKYRSRPTECEAMQWGGELPITGAKVDHEMIVAWVNANGGEALIIPTMEQSQKHGRSAFPRIGVRTINGWAYAAPGHYVVMGDAMFTTADPKHEKSADALRDFYPCDPETFERRWEPGAPVRHRSTQTKEGQADAYAR